MLFLAMKSVLDGYREIRKNGDIPAAIDSPDLNGVRTIGVCDGIEREAVADGGRRMWPVIGHVRARSSVRARDARLCAHILKPRTGSCARQFSGSLHFWRFSPPANGGNRRASGRQTSSSAMRGFTPWMHGDRG